jgi:hypothetical protein
MTKAFPRFERDFRIWHFLTLSGVASGARAKAMNFRTETSFGEADFRTEALDDNR